MAFLSMILAAVAEDVKGDPVKDIVLKFLLSYGGLAAGVSFLVQGLKTAFKKLRGYENSLVLLLMFALGALAKYLMPNVYGGSAAKDWVMHMLVLVFVAVGSAAFHDKFLNVMIGFVSRKGKNAPKK